ncbi:MAG TPA: periplasmic heavy metal sensor, partial [Candidatus Methylomirabilis sp.]|nr:periplasmic heavy metal sensor [Candidatus Methylomirabilis sp.]
MKKQWYRRAGIVAAILAMAGSTVVVAQGQQAPSPASICARHERLLTNDDREAIRKVFRDRMKERLALTDQQAEQLQTLFHSQRDQARADIQALCEARVEMRRLLDQQNSDPSALKVAAERVKALQSKLLDRRIEAQIALRSQLTPEQWAKWLELRKDRGHRR